MRRHLPEVGTAMIAVGLLSAAAYLLLSLWLVGLSRPTIAFPGMSEDAARAERARLIPQIGFLPAMEFRLENRLTPRELVWAAIAHCLLALAAGAYAWAGWSVRRLQSRRWGLAAAAAGLLPNVAAPACLWIVAAPVSVWALIVLLNRDVAGAFAARTAPEEK